jgi:hypothetical protein
MKLIQSILDSRSIEEILRMAKKNLECDGHVAPVLFLQLQTGKQLMTPLHFPEITEERRRYLTGLGFALLRDGKILAEAVMVLETWFVRTKGNLAPLTMAPSQHPQRKEAVVLIGRNATKSRSVIVMQPFSRGSKGEPIWEKVEGNLSEDDPKASLDS